MKRKAAAVLSLSIFIISIFLLIIAMSIENQLISVNTEEKRAIIGIAVILGNAIWVTVLTNNQKNEGRIGNAK